MEIKKSSGGNQSLKKSDLNIIKSESKNQLQLCADTVQIESFFRTLFCNATGGYITLRGFKQDGGVAFKAESFKFDDPRLFTAANKLATQAAAHSGVVFCSPTATFQESKNAKGSEIFNGVALSVDIDNTNPHKARKLLEEILGPPTIVIASGGEWQDEQTGEFHPKLHLHWRLTKPTTTPEEHALLINLRKLAAKIAKADNSSGPLAHPLRIPGSWHTKSNPTLCTILDYKIDVEISLEYAKERLQNYQKKEPIAKTKTEISASKEFKSNKYANKSLSEELQKLSNTPNGKRNDQLNRSAFRLGQLIACGDLDESNVTSNLLATATSIGLNQSEANHTIQSGLCAGKSKPRIIFKPEKTQKTFATAQKFPFIMASELKIKPPLWIVEDYLEENSLSVVFGDPGSGKTFIALSLAASVATGCFWYNKNVNRGSVFYIAGEGFSGISRRLKAWSIYHETPLDNIQLFISERPAQLLDQENAISVAETIKELTAKHGHPKLVVIDTLARNFGNGNENQTEDMSAFIATVDNFIRIPFNCCVLIVHHTGHSDKDRARGSMALKGAADSEYSITKQKDVLTMTTTKMKDAEIPTPLSFLLKTQEIGIVDEKNKQVTSAVLELTTLIKFDLDRIRDLIPMKGINQTILLKKMNQELQIAIGHGNKLLQEGIGTHWNKAKSSKNASIYTPFYSISTPNEQETEKQKSIEK
jgi:hypothetical protein